VTRFVDTNIFIYAMTGHPEFGDTARDILKRIEEGEKACTSTLVLCEIAWVLEAMGRQPEIKPTLEKILSYDTLEIAGYDEDDLLVGAQTAVNHRIDFNDGVNLAIMMKASITDAYTNDMKHLGTVDFIATHFE